MKITYTGRSTERKEYYLVVAKWMARELGLENSKSTLTIVGTKDVDFDATDMNGATANDETGILMYVGADLGLGQAVEVIAHEMVHVRQHARGYHKIRKLRGKRRHYWMGRLVREDVPYLDLPWEKQAFAQQASLTWKFGEAVARMRAAS